MAHSWTMSRRFTSVLVVCAFACFAGCFSSDDDPTPDAGSGTDAATATGNDASSSGDAPVSSADASTTTDATTVAKNTVIVANYTYEPSSLTIKVGETVTWKFEEGSHSVTSGSACQRDDKFDSEVFPSPHTFEHKFDAAGTYEYFCDYRDHCQKGQVGVVIVQP